MAAQLIHDEIIDGLRCLVVFAHNSHLCGYVVLPELHPANIGVNYDAYAIDVHGGLTFGDNYLYGIVDEGRHTVLGFDCAHMGDRTAIFNHGTYKNKDYVLNELRSMVQQLNETEDVDTYGDAQ